MFNAQEAILWILGQAIVAAAIWGGIRADIKGMHQRLDVVQKMAEASHARLDRYLETILQNHNNQNGGSNR